MSRLSKDNIKRIREYLRSFDRDAKVALTLFQREEMKKKFREIDEENELNISDSEVRTAIISSERESIRKSFKELDRNENRTHNIKLFVRYAVAAILVGIIFSGTYLIFFNKDFETSNLIALKDSINKSNEQIAKLNSIDLIEKKVVRKAILLNKTSSAFARSTDSITIEVTGISNQIDTLQSIIEASQKKQNNLIDSNNQQISNQIDSLRELLNTYTYNLNTRKAILNLSKISIVDNIISISPNSVSKLYIKIDGKYYLIEMNLRPVKLIPVSDKTKIESLQKIEFLNE